MFCFVFLLILHIEILLGIIWALHTAIYGNFNYSALKYESNTVMPLYQQVLSRNTNIPYIYCVKVK